MHFQKNYFDTFIKSPYDPKEYRGIILNNQLVVLLISYPHTRRGSASLIVQVGSYHDPEELQGLAHFTEHMVFLGNEKYPDKYDYFDCIIKQGGEIEAVTKNDHTYFYMDCNSNKLESTLDKFANLFINPLFDSRLLEEEAKKIQHEYENLINVDDSYRLSLLDKATCDQTHHFHKMGFGNMETLIDHPKSQRIDVRERLIRFFNENYSSHLMTLCVFGKENLDELQDIVSRRVPFYNIKERFIIRRHYIGPPFKHEQLMKEIKMVSNDGLEQLIVDFKMPFNYLKDKNHYVFERYLKRLISCRDENGLLHVLDSMGWIDNSIVCGTKLYFYLTEQGCSKIDQIVSLVFQFIYLLKSEGLQEWVIRELNKRIELREDSRESKKFSFIDPTLCANTNFKRGIFDCIKTFMRGKNPEFIMEDTGQSSQLESNDLKFFLNHLNTANLRIIIKSKNFVGMTDQKEKYYSTEYRVDDISEKRMRMWQNVGPSTIMKLPKPNQFINYSKDATQISSSYFTKPSQSNDFKSNKYAHPILIDQNEYFNVWFSEKNVFNTFKSFYGISIRNPILCQDLVSNVGMTLYTNLMIESMKMFLNQHFWAAYDIEISFKNYGLFIKIIGQKERMRFILTKIIKTLVQPFDTLNRAHFDRVKRQFLALFKIARYQNMESLITKKFNDFLGIEPTDIDKRILRHISKLTFENVEKISRKFFSNIKIQIFGFGNVEKEELTLFKDIIEQLLIGNYRPRPVPNSSFPRIQTPRLENNSFNILEETSTLHQVNYICNYYQFGIVNSIYELMSVKLLARLIEFNIERVQCAYIKSFDPVLMAGVIGIEFAAQSSLEQDYVDDCIEEFLILSQDHLNKLSDRDFEVVKESFRSETFYWGLSFTPEIKFNLLWKLINSENEKWSFNFEANTEAFLEGMERITKQEIIDLFNKNLIKNKRKLSVRIIGVKNKSSGDQYPHFAHTLERKKLHDIERRKLKEKLAKRGVLKTGRQIIHMDQFRERLELYPFEKEEICSQIPMKYYR